MFLNPRASSAILLQFVHTGRCETRCTPDSTRSSERAAAARKAALREVMAALATVAKNRADRAWPQASRAGCCCFSPSSCQLASASQRSPPRRCSPSVSSRPSSQHKVGAVFVKIFTKCFINCFTDGVSRNHKPNL